MSRRTHTQLSELIPPPAYRDVVPQAPTETERLKQGLRLVLEKAVANGTDIFLVLPVKHALEQGVLLRILGDKACRVLRRGGSVILGDQGPALRVWTARTYPAFGHVQEVVLAAWVPERIMDKIDGSDPPAVIYLPPDEKSGKKWLRLWAPPGTGLHIRIDPTVELALDELTAVINDETGIRKARDRNRAKATFLLLERGGYPLDPEGIRSWAVQNGWHPADARNLAELAKAIQAGKYRHEKIQGWRSDILDSWIRDTRQALVR